MVCDCWRRTRLLRLWKSRRGTKSKPPEKQALETLAHAEFNQSVRAIVDSYEGMLVGNGRRAMGFVSVVMRYAFRNLVALFILSALGRYIVVISQSIEREPHLAWGMLKCPRGPLSVGPMRMVVVSGTSFIWDGRRCQLLGLAEPTDRMKRQLGKEFLERWFKSVAGLSEVCNARQPVERVDGTALLWVRGLQLGLPCLNEQLVQAGLVEIDESSCPTYSFDMLVGGCPKRVDWKGLLRRAIEARRRGERPAIQFDWPPKFEFHRAA